ncbi:response regulator [Cohnella luojiensis]|uniref:Response regulator n=1 Tax=Cohnella luojiensis TaxID=652876 RepID=A0A4Y8LVA7_9BACL|nr:response regulator [Cohnella luojiensis]TFE25572.1 response regulator [Cohnella luojiensis]
MKVLIADDEEHVREGIELAIDWARFGVEERLFAADGNQAIQLIRRYQPPVLFCDMSMPGMDGLELLRHVREEGLDIQIIVVSGYDDFIYTRAAIKANGVDYILKPFWKQDLEEALGKAIAAWRQSESSQRDYQQTQYRLKQADAMLDEQKLASYFNGETGYHEGLRGLLVKTGLPLELIRVALILPQNRKDLVDRRFYGDEELFIFAVNNILHEILKPYGVHYLCKLDEYQWLLLSSAKEGFSTSKECQRYLAKTTEAWDSTLGLKVLTGLADQEADLHSLPEAVRAARAILLQSKLQHTDTPSKLLQEVPPRFLDQQVLLRAALKNKDKLYAAEIIHSFVQKLKEHELQLKKLQVSTIEANLMLEHASQMISSSGETGVKFIPLWISDLNEWESLQIQQWWALMESEGSESLGSRGIQAVHDYIRMHFQNELSLSALSERFHFSPQYISKKFKEIYNTTVMTYIIELRMEKAKSLLTHTEMQVSEIANSLGYTDENYFGKVFRKVNGVSPLQYRKQQ